LAARLHVTISCGVAHEDPVAGRQDTGYQQPGYQLRSADILLYAAKRSGRNAVAYRHNGRVRLAGAAAGRRYIAQLPPPVTVLPDA
jgi:two-component system cell cycle response regulator